MLYNNLYLVAADHFLSPWVCACAGTITLLVNKIPFHLGGPLISIQYVDYGLNWSKESHPN